MDPSVSPLLGKIEQLQRDLDRANASIDDKLDRLEDAGLGVVELTKKLEDARQRIRELEEEVARMKRKEARSAQKLANIRCGDCDAKIDFSSNSILVGDQRFMIFIILITPQNSSFSCLVP